MTSCRSVFIGILFSQLASTALSNYSFPEDFLFGVSSSAYQIEGAPYEDGKVDSIWDYGLRQNPDLVEDKSNGDVACDSYHKWQEDVELIENLGANFYRFSISWPRILNPGKKGSKVNKKGVAYYNKLINSLLAKGIIPMVTIYHWDLPQSLQEKGGWANETIVEDYVYYAKTLFRLFGDRVKYWITFNEPYQMCESGYSSTDAAPFMNQTGVGGYQCGHNVLLAHGRAYREYEKKYKKTQGGKLAITVHTGWFEPTEGSADRSAAEQIIQFMFGWFIHPVVIGDYPPIMRERIDAISKAEGYLESRLPTFTKKQIKMIRGTSDFIGVNHYTTYLTEFSDDFSQPSFNYDCGVASSADLTWEVSPSVPWLRRVPWGLRKLLVWMKKEYINAPVMITENGWASNQGLDDSARVQFVTEYLSELLKAIHEDGCNVLGYSYWSVLDNFEWLSGYNGKFGMIEVDFDSPNRTRTPRQSYYVYQEIISTRKID